MNANEIMLLLSRLGEMLTPAATQVWEIYMRQVILQAQVNLVVGAVCLIGSVLLFWWAIKLHSDKYTPWEVPVIIGCCTAMASGVLIALGYLELSNPAYYTLKAIAALLP